MTVGRSIPLSLGIVGVQVASAATGLSPDLLIVLKYFGVGLGILVSLGIFGMAWRANNAAIGAFSGIRAAVDTMGTDLKNSTEAGRVFHEEQVAINRRQADVNDSLKEMQSRFAERIVRLETVQDLQIRRRSSDQPDDQSMDR